MVHGALGVSDLLVRQLLRDNELAKAGDAALLLELPVGEVLHLPV